MTSNDWEVLRDNWLSENKPKVCVSPDINACSPKINLSVSERHGVIAVSLSENYTRSSRTKTKRG